MLLKRHTGRGPVRARTTIGDDHVVVMLHGTLSQADRTLVAAGEEKMVGAVRKSLQDVMRPEAIRLVEAALDREVIDVMGDHHLEHDIICEVFLLAPQD